MLARFTIHAALLLFQRTSCIIVSVSSEPDKFDAENMAEISWHSSWGEDVIWCCRWFTTTRICVSYIFAIATARSKFRVAIPYFFSIFYPFNLTILMFQSDLYSGFSFDLILFITILH